MEPLVVIKNCSYCLIHTPHLVRYGSKPRREIAHSPAVFGRIESSLRSYEDAVGYPPNQTFIGNISPDVLATIPRPWFDQDFSKTGPLKKLGRFGEILDQESFFGLLKLADTLNPGLVTLNQDVVPFLQEKIVAHPLFQQTRLEQEARSVEKSGTLVLQSGERLYGHCSGDRREEGRDDENLTSHNLLENLCAKASGALALKWLLHREQIEPEEIDFVISCGEEACGDRYQRGGGGMAKAIAEMCGCSMASGMDVKNFCAAPANGLITAAALVKAGIHRCIAVVGGGSLAKLGMKFQAFLENDMVILDDCLASMAFLVTVDDGQSPFIHLEKGATGIVPVHASSSDASVFRHYLLRPLEALGLSCTDIDRYATELQNPEIMEFAGAGDVAKKNYRKIAATAVLAKHLEKKEMQNWITKIGMVGFAPTQGHIPSAVPYLGHAMEAMAHGEIQRVMFLSRASLFLNRCTTILDGVSFILERNPRYLYS